MAKFGEANTWIQDSDKFELYADGNGKVVLRPTATGGEPGASAVPGPAEPSAGAGIASLPGNSFGVIPATDDEERDAPE
jgi:hypothetical protein